MKYIVTIAALYFCGLAHAKNLATFVKSDSFSKLCANSVKINPLKTTSSYQVSRSSFAENKSLLFVAREQYAAKKRYTTIIAVNKSNPQTKKELIKLKGKVHDLLHVNDSIWALQNHKIVVANLDSLSVKEIPLSATTSRKRYDRAYDMTIAGSYVIVAYGAAGLQLVDSDNLAVHDQIDLGLHQANGHKSLATGIVAINDEQILVSIDNATMAKKGPQPFNGILEVNLTEDSIARYPYNQKNSGILSRHAKMKIKDGILWINNWGQIQFVKIASMREQQEVNIGWIPTDFEDKGKRWSAEPLGEFLLVGQDLFGCAKVHPLQTTTRSQPTGLVYKIDPSKKLTIPEN